MEPADITAAAFDRVFRGRPLSGSAGKRRFPYAYLSERAQDMNSRTRMRIR